jgi:mono/diheme cytochrome c family protein
MKRLVVLLGTLAAAATPPADFDQTVAPILASQCAECHSDRARTSGFSVATLRSVLAGGNKYGPAVVAGRPEQSPLVKLLLGHLTPQMPLGRTMAKSDIARIEEWIRGLRPEETAARPQGDWRWPYQKPVKHAAPVVRNQAWVRNPIDAFVLRKLEEQGIPPAPPASPRVLARRLYFDLLGLPPTPEELNAFLQDTAPDAYEKLIDRLLADPRYGERWARHWLDLVRYGETSGLEGDGAIGNAWRYRDWVIDAFNADLPYDRFVLQQLAGGDEHSKTRNNYQPDIQGHVPLGFLRLAPWDRSNLVAEEVRQNYLSEVTATTGSVFLGLTLGCARCHDHKYDPIPQKDYYRFQAFFNAIQVENVEVPYKDKAFAARAAEKIREYEERLKNGPEKKELDELEAVLLKKLAAARAEQAKTRGLTKSDLRLEIRRKGQTIFTAAEQEKHADLLEAANRTLDPEEKEALDTFETTLLQKLTEAYAKPGADPSARFQALAAADVRAEVGKKYDSESVFTEEEKERHTVLSSKLDIYRRRLDRWRPLALSVKNVPGPPNGPMIAPTRVLVRGDYRQPGEAVEPGFPTVFTGQPRPAVLETDRYRQFPTRGWRITLARWIASPENPLTARVMVNRIWQHHFGRGIVATPSDFGKNGERPTHPELLDWLAVRFVEEGWSIKAMHRLILTSSSYRQASENPAPQASGKDPDNRLLSRFSRRRIEAEALRDGILLASGRLNPERGGPSMFPPLPEDLADFARYGRTGGLMWEPNERDEDARRRSIYIFQRRSLPLPMMAAFDALPFAESCERRIPTTTPLQALSMMNGNLVHEESEHLARRLQTEAGPDRAAQIRRAFEIVLSRPPAPEELRKFQEFSGPLAAVCRVLLNSNEFLYVD